MAELHDHFEPNQDGFTKGHISWKEQLPEVLSKLIQSPNIRIIDEGVLLSNLDSKTLLNEVESADIIRKSLELGNSGQNPTEDMGFPDRYLTIPISRSLHHAPLIKQRHRARLSPQSLAETDIGEVHLPYSNLRTSLLIHLFASRYYTNLYKSHKEGTGISNDLKPFFDVFGTQDPAPARYFFLKRLESFAGRMSIFALQKYTDTTAGTERGFQNRAALAAGVSPSYYFSALAGHIDTAASALRTALPEELKAYDAERIVFTAYFARAEKRGDFLTKVLEKIKQGDLDQARSLLVEFQVDAITRKSSSTPLAGWQVDAVEIGNELTLSLEKERDQMQKIKDTEMHKDLERLLGMKLSPESISETTLKLKEFLEFLRGKLDIDIEKRGKIAVKFTPRIDKHKGIIEKTNAYWLADGFVIQFSHGVPQIPYGLRDEHVFSLIVKQANGYRRHRFSIEQLGQIFSALKECEEYDNGWLIQETNPEIYKRRPSPKS